MTPIIENGLKLLALLAAAGLTAGLLLGIHALHGGKLWNERNEKK